MSPPTIRSPDRRPRTVCITQARMGSSRLPGKVLMDVLGRPLLHHHLARLQRCRGIDAVVVATATAPADDAVAAAAAAVGVPVFRGSEDDVLDRFAGAAAAHGAGLVVRATADCPLIDPGVIDAQVAAWLAAGHADAYIGIDIENLPRGLGAEVFPATALAEAAACATDPYEREHVTPYLYRRPARFPVTVWTAPPAERPGPMRWCVDEPADFALVRRLLETLLPDHPDFGWHDVLAVLRRHPEWMDINKDVRQKPA